MMSTDVVDRVRTVLSQQNVALETRLLVAVSGGADSMVLLRALHGLPERRRHLTVCHVDHGLRGPENAAREWALVEDLCGRLGAAFVGRRLAGLRELARLRGESLEAVARTARYRILREEASRASAAWIVTAHTLNDQAETVLMRFLQGSGITGVKGIPETGIRVIRPLLSVTREQIENAARGWGLTYAVDTSNGEPRFLRNRVRSDVLPPILHVFPDALNALGREAELLRSVDRELSALVEMLFPRMGATTGWLAELFARAPYHARVRAVLSAANAMGIGGRIPNAFFEPLRDYRPEDAHGTDRVLVAGHGFRIRESFGRIVVETDVVHISKKSYLIDVSRPDTYHILHFYWVTVAETHSESGSESAIHARVSTRTRSIIVRTRRPGDRIRLREGNTSLKKLIAEMDLSKPAKDLIPVIEDSEGIVAVAGRLLGGVDRVRADVFAGPGESREMRFVFEQRGVNS